MMTGGRRLIVTLTTTAAAAAALSLAAAPAWAGGTHFLLQLHGGFSSSPSDDMGLGLGYGFLAGYGGRVRGTRLRFYGLATFDRASFDGSGVHDPSGLSFTTERSYNDVQGGVRMLIPIWWRLRWYLEALVGGCYMTGELDRDGLQALSSDGWAPLLTATTGFEVRWHRNFATGVRAELRWMIGGGEVLVDTLGQDRSEDFRITVLATQAFLF